MKCPSCGTDLSEQAQFCTGCGQSLSPADRATQPTYQTGASFPNQPPYPNQAPFQQGAPFPNQPPYPNPPPQKGKPGGCTGCLVVLLILVLLVAGAGFYLYSSMFLTPKNLGIRYTQADFDSALEKTGLQVDFLGKDTDGLTAFIEARKGEKLAIKDYHFEFSEYQRKEFELTPEEATAFVNEIAPDFTWFNKVQMKVLPDGRTAGSYQVDFAKIKEELIPDVAGSIPPEFSRFLPDAFNLYLEGSMRVINNEVQVPERLDRIDVGPVSLKPLLADLDGSARSTVFDYAERIYKIIPGLDIERLEVTESGNYAFSGTVPTRVRVTEK